MPAFTADDRVHMARALELAHLIADVLSAPDDGATLERVRSSVSALARMFPVYRA